MKEFIVNLYANKYFPLYLGIIIIVLLIAFFIVFFLGKKDQKKIEETQKLNKEDLQKGNVKNVSSELNNNTIVQSNNVNAGKNNKVETKNDSIQNGNTVINNNTNIQKTPVVNNASNKPNEIDNTPKVSTPVQNNINNANVTSINEVKPTVTTNITPNVTPLVQSNTVENKTPETKPNIIINNNPKDIAMPTKEDNKTTINANSELKKETVKIDNITSSNVVQNLTDDDDSYKAVGSKSNQDAINRFQNIASSIDKELTELEKQQKVFNQINTNIENNILNNSNEINIPNPTSEEPKVKEEKKESNTTVVSNIYSSVYVPNNNQNNVKEEETKNNEEDIDETMSIELPKLKEEPILKDENPDKFNFI